MERYFRESKRMKLELANALSSGSVVSAARPQSTKADGHPRVLSDGPSMSGWALTNCVVNVTYGREGGPGHAAIVEVKAKPEAEQFDEKGKVQEGAESEEPHKKRRRKS